MGSHDLSLSHSNNDGEILTTDIVIIHTQLSPFNDKYIYGQHVLKHKVENYNTHNAYFLTLVTSILFPFYP
jgi:hypothetical protein